MCGRGIQIGLWVAIIVSLSFPITICAAPPFSITPKISADWRRDTNFYLAQDLEREVDTYSLHPGIDLSLEKAKTTLMLDYTLDAYYYDDQDAVPSGEKPSDDDNYVGHTATFEGRYQAFDRLLVGLSDSFYLTRDPAESDDLSNSTDREKYYINRLTPLVIYEFGRKFTAGLRYRLTNINYKPSEREDATEHRGIFNLIYNFTPKTSLTLDFQHWEKDYTDTSSDYTATQGKLIFSRQFRILTISAGAGYQNRSFDDSSLEDVDVFTYNINFDGEGLIANRKSNIKLDIEQNFNDQAFGNSYFTGTRFVLSGGHEFTRKLSGDVFASYQIADYEITTGLTPSGNTELRKDDTYEIAGNIRYMFARWVAFSVNVGYEKRDSNLAGLDYDNTYYIARLEFAYDFGNN